MCQWRGVSFVATEFHTPDLQFLAAHPDVTLITAIRDPLSRLVSNYRHDSYWGGIPRMRLEEYIESSDGAICRPNYYCNALTGRHHAPTKVDDETLSLAKHALSLFDIVIVLEQPASFNQLHDLNWSHVHEHRYQTKFALPKILNQRENRKLLFQRLMFREPKISDGFLARFKEHNREDYDIYAQACRMAGG